MALCGVSNNQSMKETGENISGYNGNKYHSVYERKAEEIQRNNS